LEEIVLKFGDTIELRKLFGLKLINFKELLELEGKIIKYLNSQKLNKIFLLLKKTSKL
jgi:hypothetical protein